MSSWATGKMPGLPVARTIDADGRPALSLERKVIDNETRSTRVQPV
jgi:hypothetical protein